MSASQKTFTVIFVMGGPGAGCRTQIENIVRDFDFVHIPVTQLLKKEARKDNRLGQVINKAIAAGDVVRAHISLSLISAQMNASYRNDGSRTFIISGFPRDLESWKLWEQEMCNTVNVPMVLFYDCPEHIRMQRLTDRANNNPHDYTLYNLTKRFRIYSQQTMVAIDVFWEKGLLRNISAVPDMARVYNVTKQKLSQFNYLRRKTASKVQPQRDKPVVIFVIGGAGSGRRTHCNRILEDFDLVYLDIKSLMKAEIKSGTQVGQFINYLTSENHQVPVDLLLGLVKRMIEKNTKRGRRAFILNGFPAQPDDLQRWEKQMSNDFQTPLTLFFEAPKNVRMSRSVRSPSEFDKEEDMNDMMACVYELSRQGRLERFLTVAPADEVYMDVKRALSDNLALSAALTEQKEAVAVYNEEQNFEREVVLEMANVREQQWEAMKSKEQEELRQKLERKLHLGEGESGETEGQMGSSSAEKQAKIDASDVTDSITVGLGSDIKSSSTSSSSPEADHFGSSSSTIIPASQATRQIQDALDTNLAHQGTEWMLGKTRAAGAATEKTSLVLFAIGSPGSGVATISEKITTDYEFVRISVEELLRREVENATEDGVTISFARDRNEMAPSELTVKLIAREMKSLIANSKKNFLIHDFPRSVEDWEVWSAGVGQTSDVLAFILFDCEEDIRGRRMLGRGDDLTTVLDRFRLYDIYTKPVVAKLREMGNLYNFSAKPPVDEVYAAIRRWFARVLSVGSWSGVVRGADAGTSGNFTNSVSLEKTGGTTFNSFAVTGKKLSFEDTMKSSMSGVSATISMGRGDSKYEVYDGSLRAGDTLVDTGYPTLRGRNQDAADMRPIYPIFSEVQDLDHLGNGIWTNPERFDDDLYGMIDTGPPEIYPSIHHDYHEFDEIWHPPEGCKIVFISGGPGAGSTTQALRLREDYDLEVLQMTQLLAQEIESNSAFGVTIANMKEKNIPVPADITCRILKNAIDSLYRSTGIAWFAIVGFPTSEEEQAAWEDSIATHPSARELSHMIYLDVPSVVRCQRLLAKNEPIQDIAQRVDRWEKHTQPVLTALGTSGNNFYTVGGDMPEDVVYGQVDKRMRWFGFQWSHARVARNRKRLGKPSVTNTDRTAVITYMSSPSFKVFAQADETAFELKMIDELIITAGGTDECIHYLKELNAQSLTLTDAWELVSYVALAKNHKTNYIRLSHYLMKHPGLFSDVAHYELTAKQADWLIYYAYNLQRLILLLEMLAKRGEKFRDVSHLVSYVKVCRSRGQIPKLTTGRRAAGQSEAPKPKTQSP